MALPVSWANTNRCKLPLAPALVSHSGVAYGIESLSTATERPAVNGTPCAPRGPKSASLSVRVSGLKKIYRGLLHNISCTKRGLLTCVALIHALMPGHDASRTKPRPMRWWSRSATPTCNAGPSCTATKPWTEATQAWRPRQESNLYLRLRRSPFYPLNYGGVGIDSRGPVDDLVLKPMH